MLFSQTTEYKASRNERKQLLQTAEYNTSRNERKTNFIMLKWSKHGKNTKVLVSNVFSDAMWQAFWSEEVHANIVELWRVRFLVKGFVVFWLEWVWNWGCLSRFYDVATMPKRTTLNLRKQLKTGFRGFSFIYIA